MDEQKKKPVRRISGRLTDTIQDTEIPETREVFTPRRPVQTKIVEVRRKTDAVEVQPVQQESVKRKEIPSGSQPVQRESVKRKEIPSGGQPVQMGKRRRMQENEARMRSLWGALAVLTVLLIAAIIYEVILGHGVKQTGSQRMAAQEQENIIVILDETETESMAGTESETE